MKGHEVSDNNYAYDTVFGDQLRSYADNPNSPENQAAKRFNELWAKRIEHDARISATSILSKQVRQWAASAPLESVIALAKEIESQVR